MPRTRTLALLLLTVLPSGLQGVRVPRTLYLPSSTVSAFPGGRDHRQGHSHCHLRSLCSHWSRSAPFSGSVSPPLIGWSVCLFQSGDMAHHNKFLVGALTSYCPCRLDGLTQLVKLPSFCFPEHRAPGRLPLLSLPLPSEQTGPWLNPAPWSSCSQPPRPGVKALLTGRGANLKSVVMVWTPWEAVRGLVRCRVSQDNGALVLSRLGLWLSRGLCLLFPPLWVTQGMVSVLPV